MHRLLHEYVRIETLEGVARTPYNQFTSIVKPTMVHLKDKGVVFRTNTVCYDVDTVEEGGKIRATQFKWKSGTNEGSVTLNDGDLFFFQNGSMTDGSSIGSWTKAPVFNGLEKTVSFTLWKKLADRHPGVFGNPDVFFNNSLESMWESFTVTTKNKALFDHFVKF